MNNNIIDIKTGKPICSDAEALELLKFLATPTQQLTKPKWYIKFSAVEIGILIMIIISSIGFGWCMHAIFGN